MLTAGRDGAMDAGVEGIEGVEGDDGPCAGRRDGKARLSGKTVLTRKEMGSMPRHQEDARTGISVSPPRVKSSVDALDVVT